MKPKPEEYANQVLQLLRLLLKHVGESDAIKSQQIENALGIEPRITAEMAALLGRQGYAVCSGSDGYYYAKNEAEWVAHLEKERKRAMVLLDKVSEARQNHVNPMTLFDQKLPGATA